MVKYQDLVEGVRDRARLHDAAEAREVTGAVLGPLVRAVPEHERQSLVGALPAAVRAVVEIPAAGSGAPDVAELLDEIGRTLARPPERARYLTQAVLDELGVQDAAITERIGAALPAGTVDGLRAAGDPPSEAVTTTPERPTALTRDEVARALAGLEDWTGDERGISRTVTLPDERIEPLVNRVEREARRHNDHAAVRREPGAVTFTLRTRGSEVTEPDVELASRIDAAVADVGSGG
ncbi:MAG: DUF2267 domain-containing protein [Actinomycetota bacterium]|nr:DUF2267 domain-containing protein [Actinomycetota bacterium]